MFTGIVETTGIVQAIQPLSECQEFCILPNKSFDDLQIGDSMAVNGICLTITQLNGAYFYMIAVPETLKLTNLFTLSVGSEVNLERSMLATTRMGGHYVQGHVDGVGEIVELQVVDEAVLLVKIKLPTEISRYVIRKGFIALDGMSITVIDIGQDWCTVTFIPHTIQNTRTKHYRVGSLLNIEVDIIAKYIEKLINTEAHYASC